MRQWEVSQAESYSPCSWPDAVEFPRDGYPILDLSNKIERRPPYKGICHTKNIQRCSLAGWQSPPHALSP